MSSAQDGSIYLIPKYNFSEQCFAALSEVPVRFSFSFLLLLLLLSIAPGWTQQQAPPPFPQSEPTDADDTRMRIAHDMEKKAAKERVAALKNDTDKLLKLSIELKAYVDKSDENVMSLDVIKKAEQIEKLAKSVKDKMKGPN